MTSKAIGPSFTDELTEYGGLMGQHFSWSNDGSLEFFDDTPQDVIKGVQSVYAAHDPTKPSWQSYQQTALSALAETDKTVLRCYENAMAIPTEWADYRRALRAVISAKTGDATKPLPAKPAYPPGT